MIPRAVCLAAIGLCACVQEEFVSRDTSDIVAFCSAGYGVTLSTELAAELDAVAMGGSVSAELEQTLKGLIFAGADLSDANVLSGYEGYLDCVQQRKQRDDFIAALETRRDLVLSFLSGRGYSNDDLAELTELVGQHIEATRAGRFQTAHELHNRINFELVALGISSAGGEGPVAFYEL